MPNEKGTATTPHQVRGRLWQDNHSGRRRHKLMTKELADTIPPLYANDGADDPDAVVARVKLFSPLHRLALVHHRVGRRDRNMLRPRRGVRDRTRLLRPHGTGGSNRVRQGPRRRARPPLEADDPRRDQGTAETRSLSLGERRNKERRNHA